MDLARLGGLIIELLALLIEPCVVKDLCCYL